MLLLSGKTQSKVELFIFTFCHYFVPVKNYAVSYISRIPHKTEIFVIVCRVCCISAGQNTGKVFDSQASQITIDINLKGAALTLWNMDSVCLCHDLVYHFWDRGTEVDIL